MMFSAAFDGVAGTVAQDLISILCPAGKTIKVHAAFIAQYSDFGSVEIEKLRIRFRRGQTSQGSGGSVITPVNLDPSGAASSCTVHANDTTIANTGTIKLLHSDAFEVHSDYQIVLTPEMRWGVAASTCFTMELEGAPADSITFDGVVYFEEIG